jgi:prepilin-type N-terminal cleavage/methylation domain-containing protein
MKTNQSGFTFIELILVMGITATLFGFVTLNLVGTQNNTSVNSADSVLISDMAGQQTKAMMGTGASSGTNYGIYFQEDKYILFEGSSYSSTDPKNFTITLDKGLNITNIRFPNSILVFSARSGAVVGFVSGSNSVTIQDVSGLKVNTIAVNRYGVVIREN